MPPIIPLIIAGIGAGLDIKKSLDAPGIPKIDKAPPLTPLTANQNQAQQTAVGQALPTLQSLTGGSLSPEYAAQFGATQSGLSNDPQAQGNIQAAINSFFGLTAPGTTGLSPSSSTGSSSGGGILDLLKLPVASTSGPPISSGGPPGGIPNWIQQQLQGNDFRGLAG